MVASLLLSIRQYESTAALTPAIQLCFQVLTAILACRPVREFHLGPVACDRFVVASDAALEKASGGSGGFLIVWLQDGVQVREGFVADIPEGIYALWSPGDKKIAQLELLMVFDGLVNRPSQFRGRRGIWFIDNIAALMSLIRGRSSSPRLGSHFQYDSCCTLCSSMLGLVGIYPIQIQLVRQYQ